MERITPMATPNGDKARSAPKGGLPKFIIALALLTALGCLAGASYFFLGFYENDPQIPALIPAFLLCFGIAGIGVLPALMTAALTRRVRPGHNHRRCGWLIIGFNLPWIMLGLIMTFMSGLAWYWGALAAGIALIFTLWGLALLTLDKSA